MSITDWSTFIFIIVEFSDTAAMNSKIANTLSTPNTLLTPSGPQIQEGVY